MRARHLAGIAAVLGWLAAAASVAAEPPPGATVAWESGRSGGEGVLTIRFPSAPPDVAASVGADGLQVIVRGVDVSGPLPAGVRADAEGGGTRLRLEREGVVLRGVRVQGNAVAIEIAGTGTAAPSAIPGAPAYAIGVGDVVTIAVYKNPDLSGDFTVAPEGTIAIPLLGAVAAAGRTEAELAAAVERTLAKDFLVDPQVSASVKLYQSQFVYVTGAVQRSSKVAIRPGVTLRGVLSEAGVALTPGMTVELRRADGASSTLEAGGLDTTAPLDGDVLTVQEPRYVSIYGEVRRSSRLPLVPGMTLLQAIAMAEGLSDWANKKEIRILRKGPDGNREIDVNLRAIEEGREADPPLESGDVVIVKRRLL